MSIFIGVGNPNLQNDLLEVLTIYAQRVMKYFPERLLQALDKV